MRLRELLLLNTSQAKDEEKKESMSMSGNTRGDHFSTTGEITIMATPPPGGGAVNAGGIRGRGGGQHLDGDAADDEDDDEDDDDCNDSERKEKLTTQNRTRIPPDGRTPFPR